MLCARCQLAASRLAVALTAITALGVVMAFGLGAGCAGAPSVDPAAAVVASAAVEEAILPGQALVGLRPPTADLPAPLRAALAGPALAASTLTAVGGGYGEVSLGGVRAQVVRALYGDRDAGQLPLVVLRTGAADAAATRADLARLQTDPRVRYAEPDRLRRVQDLTPNDPRFKDQQNLAQIRLPGAWGLLASRKRSAVTVAVLDTGVLTQHPDLQPRLWTRKDGSVDGYDFVSVGPDGAGRRRGPDPSDPGGRDAVFSSGLHGTHVAGIIAAASDNSLGIAGVCWDCRVLAVRVLGVGDEASGRKGGTGLDSDIVDALRWASGKQVGALPLCEHPAQVINLSFGGGRLSFSVKQAIDEAIHSDVTVVAAAGNNGDDPSGGAAGDFFPGGLDDVVSVGSADGEGRRSFFSSFGDRVDLLAPGEGILSSYRMEDNSYGYDVLSGTSQAAPHVAGAVGLLKSLLPKAAPRLVIDMLWESADAGKRCDDAPEKGCGAGLLDTQALVQLAAAQSTCTCPDGQYCLRGGCRTPQPRHTSVLAYPMLDAGCSVAPAPGRARPAAGVVLLLLIFLPALRRLYYIAPASDRRARPRRGRSAPLFRR